MSATCHIVCAGPCSHLDIDLGPGDFVIASDGGYAHCLEAGIVPDLYVGDRDSLPGGANAPISCEAIELPCEKDDTDTIAACREGLARGYTRFALHCALGGDVGHELANIQTLSLLDQHGAHGVLHGDAQRIYLVTPATAPLVLDAPKGMRVSVFAQGGAAHGVFERGLDWELEDVTLSDALPLGVSNRAQGGCFQIGVREGALLVVVG